MRSLPLPQLKAKDALLACADAIEDADLAGRLRKATSLITTAEGDYLARGPKAQLYLTASATGVGTILSKAEMSRVYAGTFVRKGSIVRQEYYDELFSSAPNGVCPFCYHRTVATLDHYLPKSKHPSLAVTPVNLVPSCSDCNKGKLASAASTAGTQLLHPYFDDVDDEVWLFARVVNGKPPALTFHVTPPQKWTSVKRERVGGHFRSLNLNGLFTSQAGRLVGDLAQRLNTLRENGGPQAVADYLAEEAATRRVRANNSWQAAAYDAMSGSASFCAYVHVLD